MKDRVQFSGLGGAVYHFFNLMILEIEPSTAIQTRFPSTHTLLFIWQLIQTTILEQYLINREKLEKPQNKNKMQNQRNRVGRVTRTTSFIWRPLSFIHSNYVQPVKGRKDGNALVSTIVSTLSSPEYKGV